MDRRGRVIGAPHHTTPHHTTPHHTTPHHTTPHHTTPREHTMTTAPRTRLRPTALAVALAASLGLITGTAAATAVYAAQPAPEPIVRTVVETVPNACIARVATDAVEAIKLSGRQGVVLEPDNGEAYAYRLAECGE